MQQAILGELRQQEGEILANELCWRLRTPSEDDLPTNFYKSFSRALGALEKGGRIEVHSRRLVDVDEVVRFYPSKARMAQVKKLRHRLLPVLKCYLEETGTRKFGAAKNELHILKIKPPSRKAHAAWVDVESRLLAIAPQASHSAERAAVIALLWKARAIFEPVRGTQTEALSFLDAITAFLNTRLGLAHEELGADLKSLYSRCFVGTEADRASLKDALYAVVDFRTSRTHFLKDDFKNILLTREPEYIKSLQGHVEHNGRLGFLGVRQYSELLEALLRRDVLGRFSFVSNLQRSPNA